MNRQSHQFPESVLTSLEKDSNRNLILFYADELRKIQKGTNPKKIPSLSSTQRKRLHRLGVLEYDPYKFNVFRPSRRALEILEEAEY